MDSRTKKPPCISNSQGNGFSGRSLRLSVFSQYRTEMDSDIYEAH